MTYLNQLKASLDQLGVPEPPLDPPEVTMDHECERIEHIGAQVEKLCPDISDVTAERDESDESVIVAQCYLKVEWHAEGTTKPYEMIDDVAKELMRLGWALKGKAFEVEHHIREGES